MTVDVAALPPRIAGAVHALLVACDASRGGVRAAGVHAHDRAAASPRHTGAALREALQLGLAYRSGRRWSPTALAVAQRAALERTRAEAEGGET